jgi:microcystin-dependent protein
MATDQFVAEIRIFGCNFPPVGWAQCNGQLLSISSNSALFSLVGTTYGGNGTSTFGLPNLQGNAALGMGNGAGLTPRFLGETGGVASVTLLTSEMPLHTHTANGNIPGNSADPGNTTVWGNAGSQRPAPNIYATTAGTPAAMNGAALGTAGGSLPHNNMMPYLVLNFCIAMQGVFPSRA